MCLKSDNKYGYIMSSDLFDSRTLLCYPPLELMEYTYMTFFQIIFFFP